MNNNQLAGTVYGSRQAGFFMRFWQAAVQESRHEKLELLLVSVGVSIREGTGFRQLRCKVQEVA